MTTGLFSRAEGTSGAHLHMWVGGDLISIYQLIFLFFKTASFMKEQLEQLTKKHSNVTSVIMDVIKHEDKLSTLVKKHDLVIRSEF